MSRLLLISLGSNLGDRQNYLKQATTLLEEILGKPILESEILETEPVGVENHPKYLNQVVVFQTAFTLRKIFEHCLLAEIALGRDAKGLLMPRTIDIDILAYGNEVVQDIDLQIPHPRLHQRQFLMELIFSILPDWQHPGLQKSVAVLLEKWKV